MVHFKNDRDQANDTYDSFEKIFKKRLIVAAPIIC